MRSCLIDGEVLCCDERGVAVFHVLRQSPDEPEAFLYAFGASSAREAEEDWG